MNFWKRNILIVLSIVMTLSVVGCTPKGNVETNQEEVNVTEEAPDIEVPEEAGSIVVTDHLGREVIIEKKPERIVSGYYITSSMLIALGLEDNVVGIEAKANSRPIYSLSAPQLLDLPNVGTAKEFNLEGCIALNPELVILPIKLKDAVESLEGLGINVIAVNPEDMDLLKETLTMIGQATGTEDRANELLTYYDEKVAEVSKLSASGDQRKVYLGGNSDFLSTATGKMYQNYMIETAGAINAAGDIDDTYWATISYEQLLAYNPGVIIIVPGANYTKEDLLKDDKLAPITAIKNKEIYTMPDRFEAWDSPVPSGILGTMWLTSVLNEENYSFDTFKEDAAAFYETFYDFNIDKEMITK